MNKSKDNCVDLACIVELLVCLELVTSVNVDQLSRSLVMEELWNGGKEDIAVSE